jgi:hypothetical protein
MNRIIAPIGFVLLVALLMAACQPIVPEDQLPDGEGTATVEATSAAGEMAEVVFVAVEFAFDAPESIPAGLTRIVLDNQGELPHDFFLFRLEEGRTLDDVMRILEEDPDAGPPEWLTMFGGTEAGPGEQGSYVANLLPGEYGYLSFGSGEEGQPSDAAQGMVGGLTVLEAGATTSAEALQADQEVEMVEYAFNTEESWAPGEQTVHVVNAGEEAHHMVIFRMREGATFADFQPFLTEEAPAGEPPADYYGGMYDLSPGVDVYFTKEFEPGSYIFLCFLPSEENDGAPHFALGMLRQVTVE